MSLDVLRPCHCCGRGCRSRWFEVNRCSNRYGYSDRLGCQAVPLSPRPGPLSVPSDVLTRFEVLKVIGARVEFFRARSNPADAFHTRESRDAYALRDDYMNADDYIFIWKKSKEGRLLLTLEECGLFIPELEVRTVQMGVDNGKYHEVEFAANRNSRNELEITIRLNAAILRPSRLEQCSPSSGTVEDKYVTLNVLLEVAIVHSVRSIGIPATVFCQVRENEKTRMLYISQRCKQWWKELPQSQRNALKCAPLLGKMILERKLPW